MSDAVAYSLLFLAAVVAGAAPGLTLAFLSWMSHRALPTLLVGQPGRPDSEVAATPETRDMKTREGT